MNILPVKYPVLNGNMTRGLLQHVVNQFVNKAFSKLVSKDNT